MSEQNDVPADETTRAVQPIPRVEVAMPEAMLIRVGGIMDDAAKCRRFIEYRVPAHVGQPTVPINDLLQSLWGLLVKLDSDMRAEPPPGLEAAAASEAWEPKYFRAGVDVAAIHGRIRDALVAQFQRLMLDTVVVRREEGVMFEKTNVFLNHPKGRYSCCPSCKAPDGAPLPRAAGCENAACHDDSLVTCEPVEGDVVGACGFGHLPPAEFDRQLVQEDLQDSWACAVEYRRHGSDVIACRPVHVFGKRGPDSADCAGSPMNGKVS